MQILVNSRVMVTGVPDADDGQSDVFLDIDDGRYFLRRVPTEEADGVMFEIAVALTGWVSRHPSVLMQEERTVYR